MFRQVLAEAGHLAGPNIGADTKVSELTMDSLEVLEFLMQVEERTGVEISGEEIEPGLTFGQLSEIVSSRAS